MEYNDDFKIGDRVCVIINNKKEYGTITNIDYGLYLVEFDDAEYYNTYYDSEKIFKVEVGE